MAKRKYWTPFKVVTLTLASTFLLGACAAKSQEDVETAFGSLVGAGFFGVWFGLLDANSTFSRGS